MGELADKLGNRVAGDLIRAEDWNALVAGVEAIETVLKGGIAALRTDLETHVAGVLPRLGALEATAETLATEVDTLRGTVEALERQFRQVTLASARASYTTGELAEISARVSDIRGQPLDLADPEGRPWIDFITVWGQLKPVARFASRGGAGDRTISVQVDATGEARVLLRAEHAEGFSDEAEAEIAAALTTQLPSNNNLSVAATILAAATPLEASNRGAFKALSTEYDRADARSMRAYVDTYYVKNPVQVSGKVVPIVSHRWRDYRATVMAFAKPDAEPLTPDGSLGSASIQVTFRDWIGPWVTLDYFAEVPNLAGQYGNALRGLVDPDLDASATRIKSRVTEIVNGKGLLAKQRDYQALKVAVERIEVTDPPPFLSQLTLSVRQGLAFQQATELNQAGAIGLGEEPIAFDAVTDTATRAGKEAAAVRTELTSAIQQELADVQIKVQTQVREQQQGFRDELLREDGPIISVQRSLVDINGKVSGFQQALGQKADVSLLGRFVPGNQ